MFFFSSPFFVYIPIPSSLGTLCHGLILYCTCAPDQTNLKYPWVQSNSVTCVTCVCRRVAATSSDSTRITWLMSSLAHGLAHGLTQGWDRATLFSFHQSASLSFVHMGFIIFLGITLLLHEQVPCSSRLSKGCLCGCTPTTLNSTRLGE
jgi:hypothetical protein